MRFPNCCGSEDGYLLYGVDPAPGIDTMVEVWVCDTCGVITVLDMIQMQHTDGPPAL